MKWPATHEDALSAMIHLHDRFALEGRDADTYINILWCVGVHDRPQLERPVFGMTRSMTSGRMERKTAVDAHIREITQGSLL